MNPLQWKREHQIALLISAAIGFIFCSIIELYILRTPCEVRYECIKENIVYWTTILLVGAFGGIIGAAIIYVIQLMLR